MRILFVCLGNICRSPTAEAVMRGLVAEAGLEDEVAIESAGTGDWHIGSPPDRRSVAAAAERGVELAGSARQVTAADFERFDLLIAMDAYNRDDLLAMAPDAAAESRVRMLREFGDEAELDVPDPYDGDGEGFAKVIEIVERNSAALLEEIRAGRLA
jgi:protein-tyrosine phosphatase